MTYALFKPRGQVDPVLGFGEMPDYETMRGDAEQLRDEAKATLGKYTQNFEMTSDEAQQALLQGEAWARDNQSALEAYKKSNGADAETPADLALMMRQEDAQKLIRACYWSSAVSVSPQISGAALEASQRGTLNMTPQELQSDLFQRNKALASFKDMDKPGKNGKSILEEIFNPNPKPLNGLGELAISTIVIIVLGIVLALSALAFVISSTIREYWKTKAFASMCQNAQAAGDAETVKQCMTGLKPADTEKMFKDFAEQFGSAAKVIGVAAVVVSGLYLYSITPKRSA